MFFPIMPHLNVAMATEAGGFSHHAPGVLFPACIRCGLSQYRCEDEGVMIAPCGTLI